MTKSHLKMKGICTRQFALKGLSDILPFFKKGKIKPASPTPNPFLRIFALFEHPAENNKHPDFEWRGGWGVWIVLFFAATPSEDSAPIILSSIRDYEGKKIWFLQKHTLMQRKPVQARKFCLTLKTQNVVAEKKMTR